MVTGQMVLNTVTDAGMLIVFEATSRSAGLFFQAGPQIQAQGQTTTPPRQIFNNVTLAWNGAPGLKVLAEVLQKLADLA
jgi:hypothetical protein